MSTVLVAAFEPFGGSTVNPALEAAKLLPERLAGHRLVRLELPVSFARCPKVLRDALLAERPEVALCVGQAAGRASLSVERVAINLIDARIPDNDGAQPHDVPVREGDASAYFATVDVRAMVAAAVGEGIPAELSCTAGTFLCNSSMYDLLSLQARELPGTLGGFIHVPCLPEQVAGREGGLPSMSLSTTARGLELLVGAALP